jgi:tetratricopeptide (TPR) repeat protein
MRIHTMILLIALNPATLFSQDLNRIDSLLSLMQHTQGPEQFNLFNELAWEYRFVNQDSTIFYAQKAYSLGTKLALKKRLAKPLNFIGVAHEYKGEAIEAYDFYKQALAVATAQDDALEIAYANNNKGRLLFNQGNVARSSECYQIALKIFEDRKDSIGMAYVYLNLAQLHQFQKEFETAEGYFKKVYQIRLKKEGAPNISSLLQLGIFYREFGEMKKSNSCFQQADSLCALHHDEALRTEVSILLAENRLKENNLKAASEFAERAFDHANLKRLSRHFAGANFIMGKVAFEKKEFTKAKQYFQTVVNNSKPFKDVQLKMDSYYFLGQIYSREGLKEHELKSQNQYLILRDSVKERDLAKQIDRLQFQFKMELEQRVKENELLKTIELRNNTIIRKQQILNVAYAIALIIIVVVALVLYRNVKLKNRHSLEIERMNESLETIVKERTKTINEQNVVLREYAYFNAHQIRGPLARILGLISVLDLEFKRDSFGPYMNMLQQAGTDLDDAIKEINSMLNTVDENV